MKLSVCYLVKDEILKLPFSVQHTKKFADEVVIVDTGSVDGTKEYAKFKADKYEYFKWCDDFSKARNRTLSLATGDWILILDADEWIHPDEYKLIRELMNDEVAKVFLFQTLCFMQDPTWIEKPLIYYGSAIRMFKNGMGYFYDGIVHNELMYDFKQDNKRYGKSELNIYNRAWFEKDTIEEKCRQNKKLLDLKIKQRGWTFLNCVHYSDVYRKLWFWTKDKEAGSKAIFYLNMALRKKYNQKLIEVRNHILKEIQK